MQATLFMKNKIARQIAINGQKFAFVRNEVDEYHQQLDEKNAVATIAGIFHEATSYVKETNSDGGRMISKPQPMILTLCDDNSRLLEKDDEVTIGDNVYHVIEKHDIKGLGIAYDISLEVIV